MRSWNIVTTSLVLALASIGCGSTQDAGSNTPEDPNAKGRPGTGIAVEQGTGASDAGETQTTGTGSGTEGSTTSGGTDVKPDSGTGAGPGK